MPINRSELISIMNEVKTGSIIMKLRVFSSADNIDEPQTINTNCPYESEYS